MSTSLHSIVAETHKRLEQEVKTAAARLNVPGVAVGVYVGGEEHYLFHGITSVDNPLPVKDVLTNSLV